MIVCNMHSARNFFLLTLPLATKSIPVEAPNVLEFNIFDDFYLVPQDGMPLLPGAPDQQIVLGLSFFTQNVPGNEQYR